MTAALDIETERVVERTIGCAVEVHRALGPGYAELIYADAMALELDHEGLRFGREVPVEVRYRGQVLRTHRLDLVVADRVLLELKAVERLERVHHSQVVSYLRSSGLRVGLLVNFNVPVLKGAFKRIVL